MFNFEKYFISNIFRTLEEYRLVMEDFLPPPPTIDPLVSYSEVSIAANGPNFPILYIVFELYFSLIFWMF